MRTISSDAMDDRLAARSLAARLTIRDTRLVFSERILSDSLSQSDPSTLDACSYSTGILRVVNYLGDMYYQVVASVVADDPWADWVDAEIELLAGSRPGVEGGRIWYQKADGDIAYCDYSGSLGEETIVTDDFASWPVTIAPVTADLAYVHLLGSDWARIAQLESDGTITEWSGRAYGAQTTARFFDAARLDGIDHLYWADEDNGRLLTMSVIGDIWSDPAYVVPLDVVDDTSFFRLGYASVINSQIWLSGRLSRATEHSVPVAFDVYMIGPWNYSMGRDLFIQQDEAGGKLFLIGNALHYIGVNSIASADATVLVGVDLAAKKIQTTKFRDFSVASANATADRLMIALDPSVEPTQLRLGSQLTLEAAYGGHYFTMGVFGVDNVSPHRGDRGEDKTLGGRGWAMKRLGDWRADQSYDYWSQAKQSSDPAEQTELVRISGRWGGTPLVLEQLNVDGIMYAVAKPSRGGLARVKFQTPTGDFDPLYGPGICFYRESRAEAAARLGIETKDITDADYGNNGFFALYGSTEHEDGPGVALYEMVNSVSTKLASADLTITAEDWHWLQIEFHEGLLRVLEREDGTEDWNELIETVYDDGDRLPWARETFGRGALFLNNRTVHTNTPGFGAASMLVPVDDNSVFTAPETVVVDDEQISFSAVSPNYSLGNRTVVDGYTHHRAHHANTYWQSHEQLIRAQTRVDATGDTPIRKKAGETPYFGQALNPPWGYERMDRIELYVKTVGTPTADLWVHIVDDQWDLNASGESQIVGRCNTAHAMEAKVSPASVDDEYGWVSFDLSTLTAEPDRWVNPLYKKSYWIVVTGKGASPWADLDYTFDLDDHYMLKLDESLTSPVGCTRYLLKGDYGEEENVWHFRFWRDNHDTDALLPFKLYGITNRGPGYEIYLDGATDPVDLDAYNDMALVVVDGPGKGSVFKIIAYDYQAPDQWVTTNVYRDPDNWESHVGEEGHGAWVTPDLARVFVEERPSSLIGPGSIVKIYPTLLVDERGANSTVAASHGPGVVGLYRDLSVALGKAEFYSLEKDLTIEDLIRELAIKSGVTSVVAKRALSGNVSLVADEPSWLEDRLNCVADFTVPTLAAGNAVGIIFRSDDDPDDIADVAQGYQLMLTSDGDLELRRFDTSWAVVERYAVPFTPAGTMRVSVQSSAFSVWIGGRFVHTFVDDTYATGLYVGMVADANLTVTCDWQDVDVYKDNFIFDIGKTGLSLASGIIGPRRIYFGDEQSGGLRLFRTRDVVPGAIDLAQDVSFSQEDQSQITRIRSEGANFAEAVDYDRLRSEGNRFDLINASEANDAWDAYREAELVLAESAAGSSRTIPVLAADPRVQAEDQITVTLPDGDVDLVVEQVSFGMQMDSGSLRFDMEIDGRAA